MSTRRVRYRPGRVGDAGQDGLAPVFDEIRRSHDVPGVFPDEVLERAGWAAEHVRMPERDETELPFFTLDPPGSTDLDQAMHLSRDGDGFRVRYAIADLPSVVEPGDTVDQESWRRGQTVYAPDTRTPLHPPVLSEGAVSLLPGQVRPAYLWDLRLDPAGAVTGAEVGRARVRSVERLDYETVQATLDAGGDDERLDLLRQVGLLRIEQERERGGANLPMPDQEVVRDEAGRYATRFRPLVPAEDWNAQVSLMTGMAAARIMLDGSVGILRTMPPPAQAAVDRLRHEAKALGVPWPGTMGYGEMLRTLDPGNPRHLALLHEATTLFRGAGYTPFDGPPPDQPQHAAVASPYAHVTAPLRRLVDRFGLAVCAALCAGEPVPGWVRAALPRLPEVMARSDSTAGVVTRECLDAVEAAVLAPRVGETFPGRVVDVRREDLLVQIAEPAVLATATGRGSAGQEVAVRLLEADVEKRSVRFAVVPPR